MPDMKDEFPSAVCVRCRVWEQKKYLCGKFTQKYLDVKVIRYIFAYEIHNNLNR